jgi:hypothetical protein
MRQQIEHRDKLEQQERHKAAAVARDDRAHDAKQASGPKPGGSGALLALALLVVAGIGAVVWWKLTH